MGDFISRTTFGFLMAQLFPGTVAVFAIAFAHAAIERRLPDSTLKAIDRILLRWQKKRRATLLFLLALCVAAGMVIHAFHWSVLGTLERGGRRSMFASAWHRQPIAVQVVGGVPRMMYETYLLASSANVYESSVFENVPLINDEWMKQHEFMQDFYLYTAQFLAHTAYALLFCAGALLIFMIRYGFTWRRCTMLLVLWLGIGGFLTLSRLQFCSLFRAEAQLILNSGRTPPNTAPTPPPPASGAKAPR